MDNNLLKVLMTSIPGRYARALFAYAQQCDIVERLSVDLGVLDSFCKKNPRLWQELSNKALTPQQTTLLWQDVSEKLRLHSVLTKFILLLSQAKRLNFWPAFIQYYQLLNDAAQGKRQLMVRTPTPLSDGDQKQLIQALQKLWAAELLLTYIVVPNLKMGLVVESNNLCLDVTLDAHLASLHQILSANFIKQDV